MLAKLTDLQHLTLEHAVGRPFTDVCSLSALQRLTSLHMGFAGDTALLAFAGCTGLRELRLTGVSPA